MDLFPAPSASPAKLSPNPWPGVTPESTNALRELLKDNHEKWHVFFDPRGFHNHTAHYLSALWLLGADAEVLKVAYTLDTPHQIPIKEYPEALTEQNFKEHLGDEKYFGGYLKYYEEYIKDKDISDILEKQIFNLEANFDPSKPADKQPAMLDRFLDAIIHPMIHVGYGLELGIPGLLVEGLASTATHQASGSKLLPKSLWKTETSAAVDSLTRILPSVLRFGSSAGPSSKKNVHAFDILSRMLKDPAFDNIEEPFYLDVWIIAMEKYGDLIEKHVQAWTYDSTDPNELNKKIEELVYMNALIYGVAGWKKGEEFNADFLYMHLITTSIFLPTIAAYLKPQSQELLLRSYLVISVAWWIAHGRQNFDVEGFFSETNAYPVPPGPKAPVHEHALPNASSFKAGTPNPWLHIVQGSIAHPDDHLPKLQRALAHWSSIFGSRPAGQADFTSTELKSADKIDGTIFIRTAGLTHERATAFKEGYTNTGAGTWDRRGFKEKRDGGVQEH